MKKQKIKTMTAKSCRDKGRISLCSKKEENYKDNIKDNTDSD